MGEKTLSKFREAFLEEVDLLLPQLLDEHGPGLIRSLVTTEMIDQKINEFSVKSLEQSFKTKFRSQLNNFSLLCMICGLALGLIQWLVFALCTLY